MRVFYTTPYLHHYTTPAAFTYPPPGGFLFFCYFRARIQDPSAALSVSRMGYGRLSGTWRLMKLEEVKWTARGGTGQEMGVGGG
jgi:hypothetical protein